MNKTIQCTKCKLAYNAKDGKIGRKPLLLHCGHTFCEVCLTQLYKERKTSIVCPNCLGETSIQDGDEGGIHSLQVDRYVIGRVIQSRKQNLEIDLNLAVSVKMIQRKKQQTLSDKNCKECTKKPASSYCAKCDCRMCVDCFQKVHSLSKTLQSHRPLPLTDDDQLEMAQMCKEHETRPLEYFCEDDEVIICSRCVIVGQHKGHNISSIEDKNKLVINEMEPNLQMANHVYRRLKRIDQEIAACLPDSKKEVGPVLEEVSKYFQYLHGVLQVREHQLQEELFNLFKAEIEPVEKLRSELQMEYRRLDSTIKSAHRIMNNNDEIIVNAKDILDKLVHSKDIPCILEHCSSDVTSTNTISFIPGVSIDSVLLNHGKVNGYLPKRFDMFTMREKPEKFTEDKQSLGTTSPTEELYSMHSTPFDACSINSATTSCSEDVIIEDEQEIILDDSAPSKSDDVRIQSKGKKQKSKLTKTRAKNKVEDVTVTHIVNPRRFCVTLNRDSGKLTALSYSLQQWCNSSAANKHRVDGVDNDDIVLAQYSADKLWYRSRVKQVIPAPEGEPFDKTMVEVLYFDYGNSERVPVSRLRNMQSRFMKHPEFSIECCLIDLLPKSKEGIWSAEAVTTFVQIVEHKLLLMTVLKEENNIIQVDLSKPPDSDIIDDTPMSVRDALVFLELANFESPNSLPNPRGAPAPNRNFIRPEALEEGFTYDVQVSFAGTPDNFYVQEIGEEYDYLQKLTVDLQSTYSAKMKDSWQILCPFIGMICVAQFTGDEMWYRARIVDIPGKRKVQVHFVDYGNVESTDVFKIRKILDSFLILPAQAILCKLTDVEPNNANEGWADQSLRWWSEVVTMQRFDLKIVNVDEGFHVVMRQREWMNSDSVNLKMVMEGKGRSVGKWSEPPNIEVESSLTKFVPTLSYQTGEGSFPEPTTDIDAQPIYWKSRQPRATRKYQETVLTPPSSPVLKSKTFTVQDVNDLKIPDVVFVPKQSPTKVVEQSPKAVNSTNEKQPMDISPTHSEKESSASHGTAEHTDSTSSSMKTKKVKAGKKHTEDIEVLVSNYVAPSEFYLQISNAGRAGLNDLMREMEHTYRNSEVAMITFKQGNYCAVLSPTDGKWYRGKIKKVLQKNLMEVFMLDFGFTEIVTTTSLRNILRQFRKERSFSFCCHLADLIPAGGMNEWSKTAIDLMKSEIQNRKLYLHKRGDVVNSSLPVDLVIENYVEESALEPGRRTFVSLIELMKERGLAIRKHRETYLQQKTAKHIVTKRCFSSPECSRKAKEMTKETNSFPVLYYKKAEAVVKDGDSVMPVYVDFDAVIHCYTMEGDDQFQNMVDTIDQKFRNSDPPGSEQEWEKGQACAAFYEKDKQWHRASIGLIEPTKVQIHFIDYGNTEWVDYDQLRADIEEFIDIPQQTFLCMLHDIEPVKESGRWDTNVLEFMHKELVNKYCKIIVIEKNGFENEHMTVNLELNGKDFAGVLVQYGMAKRGSYITDQQQQSDQIEQVLNDCNPFKTIPDVDVGGIISVIVTHVELPNVVYLQNTHVDIQETMTEKEQKHVNLTNENLNKLEQLSINLNKATPHLPVIFSPKIGLPCCAQFGFDNCYYRAVIIDIYTDTDQLLVLYVDYGNSEIITSQKMRALPPKYLTLPCQSMRCRLMDIEKPSDTVSWTKVALFEMMQVLANKPLLAKITSQKPLAVELIEPSHEGEDVLVYQSVIDAGHVRLTLKPVTSPRSLEPKIKDQTSHETNIKGDRDKGDNSYVNNNVDGDSEDQSEGSTIISSKETTSKSWADMADDSSSADLNELPELIDVNSPQSVNKVGKLGKKDRAEKKIERQSRKVETLQHDDECFD